MSEDFLSHEDAAIINRNKVLHFIKTHKKVSRTDIWQNMSVSRASVTQITRQLDEAGLIMETGEKNPSGRRMSRSICVNGDARYSYIFDWTTRWMCLVNLTGDVRDQLRLTIPANCSPSELALAVTDGVRALRDRRSLRPDQFLGLGVIMPGLIDSRNCRVLYSVELGWRDVDIMSLFAEEFGDRVFLERTGNMSVLGECVFGAARDIGHVMMILLENEGIGLSTVVHGDCQHGSNFMYGELGHIKVNSSVVCSCGQRGCLEAAVQARMKMNHGVPDDEVIENCAIGISTAVNLSDPGIVLLSGKLARALSLAQKQRLIAGIMNKITSADTRSLTIHFCEGESLMGVRGMSALMFNACFPI